MRHMVIISLSILALVFMLMPAVTSQGERQLSDLKLAKSGTLERAQANMIEAPIAGSSNDLKELPVYRLQGSRSSPDDAAKLAQSAFGIRGEAKRTGEGYSVEGDGGRLEIYAASGGVWFSDNKQRWNPDLKPSLPDEDKARAMAEMFLKENNLLPSRGVLVPEYQGTTGTMMAISTIDSKRENRRLDVQVSYGLTVMGEGFSLPVTGGGAKFNLVFGDQGKVIGYTGPRAEAVNVEGRFPLIPKVDADRKFQESARGLKLESFRSTLAYYMPPNFMDQSYLIPVYIYSGTISAGGKSIPMRNIIMPATSFDKGLSLGYAAKLTPRNVDVAAKAVEKDPDEASPGVAVAAVNPKAMRSSRSLTDEMSIPLKTMQSSIYEAGTSWIGVYGGLGGSAANAQGFVNELSADGYTIDFNWGDTNAFESDWNANENSWVDDEDIVFYTGHAGIDGWMLAPPNDGSLDYWELSGAKRYGDMDMEWVIIAACGPLEDDILSPGGGDVFRWMTAFNRLHQLLGYGAVTFDNTEEGLRVARYMKQGNTIINSWFRAATEIQPSTNGYPAPYGPTVYVGVLYPYKAGKTDLYNDHLWKHGSVGSDISSPDGFLAMWVPT